MLFIQRLNVLTVSKKTKIFFFGRWKMKNFHWHRSQTVHGRKTWKKKYYSEYSPRKPLESTAQTPDTYCVFFPHGA